MIVADAIYISTNFLRKLESDHDFIKQEYIELIDFSNIGSAPYNLNRIHKTTRFPFFSINFDLEPTEENLLLLTRVTFSERFKKQADKISIFSKGATAVKKLEEFLLGQGYGSVNIIDLEQMVPFKIGSLSGLVHGNGKQILLKDIVNESASSFKQEMSYLPGFFSPASSVLEQSKLLLKENEALRHQNNQLSFDLANQKKYLEIALKQKETEHILNFYHKEYEVLPLWYKRIGHVIKVILGKRSIISFFKN